MLLGEVGTLEGVDRGETTVGMDCMREGLKKIVVRNYADLVQCQLAGSPPISMTSLVLRNWLDSSARPDISLVEWILSSSG